MEKTPMQHPIIQKSGAAQDPPPPPPPQPPQQPPPPPPIGDPGFPPPPTAREMELAQVIADSLDAILANAYMLDGELLNLNNLHQASRQRVADHTPRKE